MASSQSKVHDVAAATKSEGSTIFDGVVSAVIGGVPIPGPHAPMLPTISPPDRIRPQLAIVP